MRRESLLGVLGAATAVLGHSAPALATPPAPSVYTSATAGTVAPTPPTPPLAAALPAAQHRSHGVRRVHPHGAGVAPSAPPPQVRPAALADAGALLTNFNGVSSRDSAVTNFGQEFEPPDQGLCAGNGFVVEMVNSAYTVYDTSGRVVTGPFNINGPFNEGLTEFTSDPRCYFDAANNTWFAVILGINREETQGTIDLAVNTSGDPRTVWTVYKINTTDTGGKNGPRHPGCPCFGDQPKLGIDAQNVYITTDEFAIIGEHFNGSQIYAFAKRDLLAQSSSVHFVHFDKLSIGGTPPLAVEPALTNGPAPAEYFLDSIDPTETNGNTIGVWAMTERGLVAKGGIPKLSSLVLASEPFGVPPKGEQKGPGQIESGDDRMQQTQFIGGSIWGELDTSVSVPGERQPRAGAAWFQVHPTLSEQALASAQIKRQGYLAVAANYLEYPALQISPSGSGAMVMAITGAGRFPSAAYATLAAGATTFGPVKVAAPGSGPYDRTAERWGDYSWAVLDPSLNSTWLATEYVPPKASQTPDGLSNWGTRVLQVSAG